MSAACGGVGHYRGEDCADCKDYVASEFERMFLEFREQYSGSAITTQTKCAMQMEVARMEQEMQRQGYDYVVDMTWETPYSCALSYKPRGRDYHGELMAKWFPDSVGEKTKDERFEQEYMGEWDNA